MTSISSVSQTDLTHRRKQLRRQRQLRNLQASWRTLAVTSLAGGLAWVTTLPGWVIQQPDQIAIAGNQLLSTQAIQALLPLDYPQSLLQLQPQALATALEAKAPIAKAVVTRQLFPPRLLVHVQERQPVATTSMSVPSSPQKSGSSGTGLLDEQGKWMALESYTSVEQNFQLPTLKVLGMRESYRSYWPALYQAIQESPIKIDEIDWRDPANLIVKTDLGRVHLGAYNNQFSEQLKALDRMRQLPKHLKANPIEYIDLKNLEAPSVHLLKVNSPTPAAKP